MARIRYMAETANNTVAWNKQVKSDARWAAIMEPLTNVFCFLMFVLYCAMWVAMVGFMIGLLYFLIGGPLNMFGVFVPGISVR